MAIIYGMMFFFFAFVMVVVIRKAGMKDKTIILMLIFLQLASICNVVFFVFDLKWHGDFKKH